MISFRTIDLRLKTSQFLRETLDIGEYWMIPSLKVE
jgi:hypothetical protein